MIETKGDVLGYKNEGERRAHEFLKRLPADYYKEREVRIMVDGRIKKPDFVVVHKEIGIFVIEAKDWNLKTSKYTWLNQNEIEKRDLSGNLIKVFSRDDNPYEQADGYLNAFKSKVEEWKNIHGIANVFVTSVVCFPLISRQEFLNSVDDNKVLQNDQLRIYVDFKMWIFRDDMESYYKNPESLLINIARQSANVKRVSFNRIDDNIITRVAELLIPNFTLVGINKKVKDSSRKELCRLSEQQMRWVVSLQINQNYLLDYPGSGKTSALISKAIYLIQNADQYNKILIVTYSPNLKGNINSLFKNKMRTANEYKELSEKILIFTTDELVSQLYRKVNLDQSSDLMELIKLIEEDRDDEFGIKIFDSIFIDEIQDFDNTMLWLLISISRNNSFFFVGDISQKIYQKSPNFENLGLDIEKIQLPKTYEMYRTPKYIAQLALKFLMKNPIIKQELSNNDYLINNVEYKNTIENLPELKRINSYSEILDSIRSYYSKDYNYEEIMVITSKNKLDTMKELFKDAEIQYDVEYQGSINKITLVDFENSKGLEKEVVIIYGIEDLYTRSMNISTFDDERTKMLEESYSIRKIYIAITRALEHVILFYDDSDNPYVHELLKESRSLTNKRIS